MSTEQTAGERLVPLEFQVARRDDTLCDDVRNKMMENPGFGNRFTEHMVTATWTAGQGWHDAKVGPYGPLSMDPAMCTFHYAQEIFEGLKAYRHEDGTVWGFRPDRNAARFRRSARRLALPELDERDFVQSCRTLVEVEQDWVPEGGETSLYLRPFMFGAESFLGVRPAREALYCVIASPAGAYFSGGLKPISLWVSSHYSRAGFGGTGAAKCGGNYAASMAAQIEAADRGCDQSVFLDSREMKYLEELGGMNVFLVHKDGTLLTPELSGSILEGVTRESLLALAQHQGRATQERKISIDEWRDGVASGDIVEAFACGTAAVVAPIGRLVWEDGELAMPHLDRHDEGTSVAMQLRGALLDIQYGRAADPFGWTVQFV